MKRTVSIKLDVSSEQAERLALLQETFARACNLFAAMAAEAGCTNRVKLHHLGYYPVREQLPELGSQMTCNAIAAVAQSYRSLLSNNPRLKKEPLPVISFKPTGSVHFDKRTYSFKGDTLSLFTTEGRVIVPMRLGEFQRRYLVAGAPKEAELVLRKGRYYFNLVLDLAEPASCSNQDVLGVDLGENVLAATSAGQLFGGGKLRHKRDSFLALRKRLQRNGSQSARQRLVKASGREARHVRHVNHEISKAIVVAAIESGSGTIAMENLTNIRKRIKAGKRLRTRLHRWPWGQLQEFVSYKAQAAGLTVVFVNPAYTSKTCSVCGCCGDRQKHRFFCFCGSLAHSDLNASRNIARLGATAVAPTGAVNRPHVETAQPSTIKPLTSVRG